MKTSSRYQKGRSTFAITLGAVFGYTVCSALIVFVAYNSVKRFSYDESIVYSIAGVISVAVLLSYIVSSIAIRGVTKDSDDIENTPEGLISNFTMSMFGPFILIWAILQSF